MNKSNPQVLKWLSNTIEVGSDTVMATWPLYICTARQDRFEFQACAVVIDKEKAKWLIDALNSFLEDVEDEQA